MKTEWEKMRSGELYDFSDPKIEESFAHARKLCRKLRTMCVDDEAYRSTIEQLIPGIPASSQVVPPFLCDHGNGIKLAENVFINGNCIMLDGAYITIGRHVLIGPNCSFCTPNHPMDYKLRREPKETSTPITIGDDTWIGSNVTVCPGVSIGARCIVAAGSVVIRSVPDDCMVAGNPAKIKKHLNQ